MVLLGGVILLSTGDTSYKKEFSGGEIKAAWGGGKGGRLQGSPAKVCLIDELAQLEDIKGQGDVVDLIEARTLTFGDTARILLMSRPIIEGHDRITTEVKKGDERRWFQPCPQCGHYQNHTFKKHFKFRKDERANYIDGSAYIECEACHHAISYAENVLSLNKGEWRKSNPYALKGVASFYWSGLNTPFMSFDFIAEKFCEAMKSLNEEGDSSKLQTFFNAYLLELAGSSVCYTNPSNQTVILDLVTLYKKTNEGVADDTWRYPEVLSLYQNKSYAIDNTFNSGNYRRAVFVDDTSVASVDYAIRPSTVKTEMIGLVDRWLALAWSKNRADIIGSIEVELFSSSRINIALVDNMVLGGRIFAVSFGFELGA